MVLIFYLSALYFSFFSNFDSQTIYIQISIYKGDTLFWVGPLLFDFFH